jgi:hypothetical protein
MFIYWKKGGVQATNEVVAMYKARDELQDKERKEMRAQITDMTGKIGRLEGIIEEKDKRIKILENVDIGKNPLLLRFMEKLMKTADESEQFMAAFAELPAILGEIKTFMESINKHMEQSKVA